MTVPIFCALPGCMPPWCIACRRWVAALKLAERPQTARPSAQLPIDFERAVA
jgi:hypothetical protein